MFKRIAGPKVADFMWRALVSGHFILVVLL